MNQNLKPFSSWDLFPDYYMLSWTREEIAPACCGRFSEKRWLGCQNLFTLDVFWLSPSTVAISYVTSRISLYENWLELHLVVWIQYDNKHDNVVNFAKFQNIKVILWSKGPAHGRKTYVSSFRLGHLQLQRLSARQVSRKKPILCTWNLTRSQCTAVSEGSRSQGLRTLWWPWAYARVFSSVSFDHALPFGYLSTPSPPPSLSPWPRGWDYWSFFSQWPCGWTCLVGQTTYPSDGLQTS